MRGVRFLWLCVALAALFSSGCGCGGGEDVTLLSIEVTPPDPVIALGTHQQFRATGIFSNGARQDITDSSVWSSSDNAVATVGNESGTKGLADSHRAGVTMITATSGALAGSTTLTVTPATLISISVSPENPTAASGSHQQFTALGTFSDGSTQDITQSVTWSSSDAAIASISNEPGQKGLASALSPGVATITAASGNISGATTLTVTGAALVSITVTPADKTVQKQSSIGYTATGTFSDNSTQDLTQSVTWSSSKTDVATISNAAGSKGSATAVSPGVTTITATLGVISGSTFLTVTSTTLVSITVTPENKFVSYHSTVQYTATGIYSDGTTKDITQVVTWSSSDTSIATISNAPGSKGLATTDGKRGTTTITATLGDISGSTKLIDP